MIDDLYSARILSLAANLPLSGRLGEAGPHGPHPGAGLRGTGEQVAKLCGSRAIVDIDLTPDGVSVQAFAQDIRACALGQAAAALLGEQVIGATVAEVRAARDALSAMLKSGGEGPTGRFEGLRALQVVSAYPARHASTLVAFDAATRAIEAALNPGATPSAPQTPGPPSVDRVRRTG